MEAWIEYIETTGRIHIDFSRDVIRNGHGIFYILDSGTDKRGRGPHIFRPYSRIVSVSSTEPIKTEEENGE